MNDVIDRAARDIFDYLATEYQYAKEELSEYDCNRVMTDLAIGAAKGINMYMLEHHCGLDAAARIFDTATKDIYGINFEDMH